MPSTTPPSWPGAASPACASAIDSKPGSGGSSSTAAAIDCGRAGDDRSSSRSRPSARPTPACRTSAPPTRGPTSPRATSWNGLTGGGGEVTWRDGLGLTEQVTYRLTSIDRFTLATTVRNPGVLSMTILGLDGVTTTRPNPYVASIVGLGWVVQPMAGPITYLSARPEDASAVWPVTLRPGEELAIVLVGGGGPCAAPDGIESNVPLTHVALWYRVLGFERSAQIGLPAVLTIPAKDPCTVGIPGGAVTYSTPDQ